MTNNSEIARLIEALTNPDTGGEIESVPAPPVAVPACAGPRAVSGLALSRLIEYGLISTYVSFAAVMFIPPYLATMSRIVSKLVRIF